MVVAFASQSQVPTPKGSQHFLRCSAAIAFSSSLLFCFHSLLQLTVRELGRELNKMSRCVYFHFYVRLSRYIHSPSLLFSLQTNAPFLLHMEERYGLGAEKGQHLPKEPSLVPLYSDEEIFRLLLKISVQGDAYGFTLIFGSASSEAQKFRMEHFTSSFRVKNRVKLNSFNNVLQYLLMQFQTCWFWHMKEFISWTGTTVIVKMV
jgi:hypothetical protein